MWLHMLSIKFGVIAGRIACAMRRASRARTERRASCAYLACGDLVSPDSFVRVLPRLEGALPISYDGNAVLLNGAGALK